MMVFMDAAEGGQGKAEGWAANAGCGAYNGDLFRATLPNRPRHPLVKFDRCFGDRFLLPCRITGVWFSRGSRLRWSSPHFSARGANQPHCATAS
jgi:hypothetical protein